VKDTDEQSGIGCRGPIGTLEGDWRVERVDGVLPPMAGVWKRIRGGRGETRVGPLPAWPFRVERRGERVTLVYRPPFSALVDELGAAPDGSWLGRCSVGGSSGGFGWSGSGTSARYAKNKERS
jgi:hypothetical protein